MGRLPGKIALITGGGADPGLGAATAARFAAEGARVLVTDIDGDSAERVAGKIRKAGGDATAMAHDVTREADWVKAFALLTEIYGDIDILVNNVGIAIPKAFVDTSYADWSRQHDTNVGGMFFGCQQAIRAMKRDGRGGAIINISSIAGMIGMAGMAPYCSSKGAVRLFTKALAVEVARDGIRVNSVHPGTIRTQHHIDSVAQDPTMANLFAEQIPMGRFGEPDDIANMNLFLASDEARYITGAEFVVDGGHTAL